MRIRFLKALERKDRYLVNVYNTHGRGAWMALEDADEENGCLWVDPGSHNEPIYSPVDHSTGDISRRRRIYRFVLRRECK
jgi:ectoine hydroxylase-related dioxygenase (phytanoyl-CoA dioxygenase family)